MPGTSDFFNFFLLVGLLLPLDFEEDDSESELDELELELVLPELEFALDDEEEECSRFPLLLGFGFF